MFTCATNRELAIDEYNGYLERESEYEDETGPVVVEPESVDCEGWPTVDDLD
jgi:hypothetical protein